MSKVCRVCNKEKKLHKFVALKSSEDGYTNICKKCHREKQLKYRTERPEKYKSIALNHKYNITLEQLNQMKEDQNYACKICGTDEVDLHIDHCHEEGHTRGLLCPSCNKGLGFFTDCPDKLHSAIKYLVRGGK